MVPTMEKGNVSCDSPVKRLATAANDTHTTTIAKAAELLIIIRRCNRTQTNGEVDDDNDGAELHGNDCSCLFSFL
jgi:hypothetical protein